MKSFRVNLLQQLNLTLLQINLDSFDVTVRPSTGSKSFVIEVCPTDTIREVKEKISQEYDAPPEEQIINKRFLRLEDSCTVRECGLVKDDTLVVSMAFRAAGVDGKHVKHTK